MDAGDGEDCNVSIDVRSGRSQASPSGGIQSGWFKRPIAASACNLGELLGDSGCENCRECEDWVEVAIGRQSSGFLETGLAECP